MDTNPTIESANRRELNVEESKQIIDMAAKQFAHLAVAYIDEKHAKQRRPRAKK